MKKFLLLFVFALVCSTYEAYAADSSSDGFSVSDLKDISVSGTLGKVLAEYFQSGRYDEMLDEVIDDTMAMEKYARLIAGFGVLFFICTLLFRSWARGEPIDMVAAMKPIAIFLLILFFGVLPRFIEVCTSPLVSVTQQMKESEEEEYNQAVKKCKDAIFKVQASVFEWDNNKGDSEGILGTVAGIFNMLTKALVFANLWIYVLLLINFLVTSILEVLSTIVVAVLYMFAMVAKVVLVVIGPLVVALTIFPYFSGSLKMWLCRYINLCMYVPMCNLVGYLNKMFFINLYEQPIIDACNKAATGGASEAVSAIGTFLSVNSMQTLYSIVAIVMFCLVPKMAGWIIDGNGNGLIGSAVGGIAKTGADFAAFGGGGALAKKLVK